MIRVGIGYDIHRTAAGRRLVLGGVFIPNDIGLDGHSDADVILHAVMDALLGAAGLGDIGLHFPPTDDTFRDASSLDLLSRVVLLLGEHGWRPVNLDAVLVAEAPRIAPHIAAMRSAIAGVTGLSPEAVGIKATTNEAVGAEGRGEAMSAQAVALIESTP